ncbi:unnamed protein product [Arabis nemorensis]|uniref:Uncharacterized protein n=1 Tax=Arabis nemorensis TaxID=586526 RepID=A0A565BJE8_9BRAS|nr:unnamed protein product [Arabis nemorensis]
MPPRSVVRDWPWSVRVEQSDSENVSNDLVGTAKEHSGPLFPTTSEEPEEEPEEEPMEVELEPDEPRFNPMHHGLGAYSVERKVNLEAEYEEDPEEDPVEGPMGIEADQVPIVIPDSPVYIEISSDSSRMVERNDSPAPVDSPIRMPQLKFISSRMC